LRGPRASRFWWIALGYFCGTVAWYAVQAHQTKYLIEIRVHAARGGLGSWSRQRGRHSWPDYHRGIVGPVRPGRVRGLRDLLFCADRPRTYHSWRHRQLQAGLSSGHRVLHHFCGSDLDCGTP